MYDKWIPIDLDKDEDECGICGGPGISDGYCDCDFNVEDQCGVGTN